MLLDILNLNLVDLLTVSTLAQYSSTGESRPQEPAVGLASPWRCELEQLDPLSPWYTHTALVPGWVQPTPSVWGREGPC